MLAHVRSSSHEERERHFTREARRFPAALDEFVWDDRAETLEYLEAVR